MNRGFISGLIFLISFQILLGQRTKDILPSITVIPRVNVDEDIRTLVDSEPVLRIGIASIKDGFDQYGYDTKDFETLYNRLYSEVKSQNITKEKFQQLLIKKITTDIIIELDLMYIPSNQGNLVRLILEANETASANSLGTKTCESNMFYTDDIGSLTINAMNQEYGQNSCFDSFVNELLIKWNKQYESGKTAVIDFSFEKNSKLTMDSKITSMNNERLKFVIEDWLNENAFDNYVKIGHSDDTNLFVEEYRYSHMETSRHIERKLYRFFDKLEVAVKISNLGDNLKVKIL